MILATDSASPVIGARWLKPGAHMNSVGPKSQGNSEIAIDLIERAHRLVCDAPERCRAEDDFLLQGTPHLERLEDLAQVAAFEGQRPTAATTVFLSYGLPRLLWRRQPT